MMKQRLSQSFGGAAALSIDFAFTNRFTGLDFAFLEL
jgi:hypothetical protein